MLTPFRYLAMYFCLQVIGYHYSYRYFIIFYFKISEGSWDRTTDHLNTRILDPL
jgi:hypothetical protein